MGYEGIVAWDDAFTVTINRQHAVLMVVCL